MALSNRDRIGKMFEIMAPVLDDFISTVIGKDSPQLGAQWADLVKAKDAKNGAPPGKVYDPLDPHVQLRMLSENITGQAKPGWFPFNDVLSRAQQSYATELRDVRNSWAHNGTFTNDDAYRALDTAERLLMAVNAPEAASRVKDVRLNLRRVTADSDDRRTLKAAAEVSTGSDGLKPWREVLQPHEDVASGNFQASEFAADLFKVAEGSSDQSKDYSDPVEFFSRTYLTEGLRDLMNRAVRRLAGDDNASPVINLQTNFGGGKTHSMLSLWHLAGNTPRSAYPQEVQELLAQHGYDPAAQEVRRAAIVGNHLAPNGHPKPDGTYVNTIWGELAWQLGGAEGYALVADSDQASTPPGAALHTLLERYAPAVILIDEWVAYARALYGRDPVGESRVKGGSFDDQFTFAQSLTEAAKGTKGVLLAISIPASESNDGAPVAGNAEEVGGAHGLEALKRLQNVVRRVADQWRPASSDEAYHIVRQRLFVTPDATALASISKTARTFVEFYRKHSDDFPREARDTAYEDRIKQTYPIHPELFDRLYEDWSSLERFQRTRGVLRLMNTVIHALWEGGDAGPLILPSSIPLSTGAVNSELSQYLPDQWKAVIDADVDGPNSEPAKIDSSKPLYGQRRTTSRLARTVFFGAAPTIGAAHKGIETQRVFLGTAVPGDVPGNFHSALNQLSDRATYFYSGGGKYWYDLQANITRRAKDHADRLHKEDVWAEIVHRLQGQSKARGAFAGVHVCPEENGDIPDIAEARLVVLHPKVSHAKGQATKGGPAVDFVQKALEQKGTANRTNRNMVVFLAADEARLEELDNATREFLAWSEILSDTDLDLMESQRKQAEERKAQADKTVETRLLNAYQWLLQPVQPEASQPFRLQETKVEGQATSLAERVTKRMGNDGDLVERHAASLVRMALNRVPKVWERGHVSAADLWSLYAQYAYMPRLRDQSVLLAGLTEQPMLWPSEGFALANRWSESDQRYVGLWLPDDNGPEPAVTAQTLVVRPEVAQAQREAEQVDEPSPGPGPLTPTPAPGPGPVVPGPVTPPALPAKTRLFASKTLIDGKEAMDFKQIFDEILPHLRGGDLSVRVEIEASSDVGFSEGVVRTVSENASTLKFEQYGFEG
ncbi:Swt1 family HEPN domain-containing protein [Janibacter anophelis]|uniref:Swt1 family HEPN domain-containing protein n=1 Tax=Janibacter anophelis TaxID=319054 RepID=UPI003F7E4306